MKENNVISPEDLYSEHLAIINDVNFTRREIDVIACLFSMRGTSKIASLLSIAPRTVVTHMRNIMLKLERNSREGVIDFIERSGKLFFIRKHYSSLLVTVAFEKSLKEISKIRRRERPSCLVVYWQTLNLKNFIFHQLKNHLTQAGVIAEIKEQDLDQRIEDIANSTHTLLLLLEKNNHQKIPQELLNFDLIDLSEQQNYYFFVFEILKNLYPNNDIEKVYVQFRKEYDSPHGFFPEVSSKSTIEGYEKSHTALFRRLFKKSQWFCAAVIVLIALFGIGFTFFKENNEMSADTSESRPAHIQKVEDFSIRSDLVIPTESVLLPRPKLIAQIDDKLKKQNGIQTVALVGIGGAGKTTLARQYACLQKASVIWEINAETYESLKASFEDLAQALAKTEEDQKNLRSFREIKEPVEKEKRILEFVKGHLRSQNNWLLIFDNVEEFSNLQKSFPLDTDTWGKGKTILTTRDSNIENNKHVNSIVYIEELDPPQKLDLFTKIMIQEKSFTYSSAQKVEIIKFLGKLPSFPLDISIAAYYLRATNASYATYLESINKFSKEFADIQNDLLKESGDYKKTRYGIITLSLQRIINTDKNFAGLLLFISLIDSQNIPRDLLDKYKDNSIVDNFIYNLKKYSLIINTFSSSLKSTFSIHRKIQEISLTYLVKNLYLEKNNQLLQLISNALENYALSSKNKEDYAKMRLLVNHCEAYLSHNILLTHEIEATMLSELGSIYRYLGDFMKARTCLEKSLDNLNKDRAKNYSKIAWSLANLGHVYSELANHKKAKELLEQSLMFYKKHSFDDYQKKAWILSHLGNVYRELGNYGKAKDLIEKSLVIYNKYFPEHHIDIIWNLLFLGYIYRDLGNYEKAKGLFEQALIICKENLPQDHIDVAWALGNLGENYNELGDYKRAKDSLQESLTICKKNLSENHVHIAWVLRHLGNLYISLGEYEKAKELLEQALIICEKHLPENHGRVALTLTCLGNVYKALQNYEKAKLILEKALIIREENLPENHIDVAWAMGSLGSVYGELGNYKKAQDLLQQSIRIYERHYGKNHIEKARVLKNIARVHTLMGQLKIAEKLLNEAQEIFQQHNHPESYTCLENLAEVYLKKSLYIANKRDIQQSQTLKRKAVDYLKQTLKVIKASFPEESSHITRIKEKLEKLGSESRKVSFHSSSLIQ